MSALLRFHPRLGLLLAALALPVHAAPKDPAPDSAKAKQPEQAKPREEEPAEPVAAPDDFIRGDASAPFAPATEGGGSRSLPAVVASRSGEKRRSFRVRMETWEMEGLEIIRRMDAAPANDPAWLETLHQDCLKGAVPCRLIHSPAAGADERTPLQQEAIVEEIYPTEWMPPGSPPPALTNAPQAAAPAADPGTKGKDAASKPAPAPVPAAPALSPEELEKKTNEWRRWLLELGTTASPTSFVTSNLGQTFNADIHEVTAGEKLWDLQLTFSDRNLQKYQTVGAKELQETMPRFTTFRFEGLYRMHESQWRLISVMEPPRDPGPAISTKRWVTLVKIEPLP